MENTIVYNPMGFIILLKKEINRFMKVYIQTMIAPLLSNILFLGVFGGMLKTRQVGIDGVGYLQFLVPGLAAMGAIFAAFQNPSFSLISQKYQNTIQDLNSYPLSNFEKVLAFILGGTFRGFLIGTLTYIATIIFVGYKIKFPVLFFTSLIATSFIFSSLGVLIGLGINSFEKMNFILAIIITPLTYFSGVFFEVSKISIFISKIIYINPIYSLINLIRFGYLGVHEGNLFLHILFIIFDAFLLFFLALIFFKKGIGLKN